MTGRSRGPRWRVLYVVVVLMIGLLVLDSGVHLSSQGHELAEAAIIVGGYGLIFAWIEANRQALDDPPECEDTDQAPADPELLSRPARRVRLLDKGLERQPMRHTRDGDGEGPAEPEQIWETRG